MFEAGRNVVRLNLVNDVAWRWLGMVHRSSLRATGCNCAAMSEPAEMIPNLGNLVRPADPFLHKLQGR
jgi:hypothetical protein